MSYPIVKFSFILLLFSISFNSFSQKPIRHVLSEYAESRLKEGIKLINAKDYVKAKKMLENITNKNTFTEDEKNVYYICLSICLNMLGESKPAIEVLRKVNKDFKYIYTVYYQIGRVYNSLGKLDSTFKYANICIAKSPNYSQGYSLLKDYYQLNYRFDLALTNAHKSLKINEANKDTLEMTGSLCDVGTVWIGLNDYKKAIGFFNQSIELHKKNGIKDNLFITYLGLIDAHRELEEYDKSFEYIKKAEEVAKTVPPHRIADVILRKGFLYALKGDSKNAIKEYERALVIFEKADKKAYIANTYVLLGRLQLEMKDYANAEKNLLKGQKVAADNQIAAMNENATDFLADVYEATGNYKKALFHFRRFKKLEDSSFTIEQEGLVRELSTKYETEKKEAENKLLITQKKAIEERQQVLYYAIGIIMCFLGVVIFLALRLQKSNAELKELNKSREKLFTIIAHDLKSPFNSFQGLASSVNYLIKNKQFERLESISLKIDEISIGISSLINNLLSWSLVQQNKLSYNPKSIDLKMLIEETLTIYRDVASLRKISIDENIEDETDVWTDPNGLSLIIRNLLDNAIKYSSDEQPIKITAANHGDYQSFSIENKVKASNDEQISVIKNLFSGKLSPELGQKGLGIGLVMVYQFVKMSKSKIVFTDEPNGWLKFELQIPNKTFA